MKFTDSLQSEWLKTKRSAASWLCIFGGFFIPTIFMIMFLKDRVSINMYYPFANIWKKHFFDLWQNMANFLLPIGVILAASLITQMEYKNNTWKQLHTTPQSYSTVFLAKFSVIGLMTIKFFIFFNIGIILTGIIPSLIFEHRWPVQPIPVVFFLIGNLKIFATCLPILAIQYMISLRFKNFMVSIGAGFLFWIATMIGFGWKYIFISPYFYCPKLIIGPKPTYNLQVAAMLYFVILMLISYFLYVSKKEKG